MKDYKLVAFALLLSSNLYAQQVINYEPVDASEINKPSNSSSEVKNQKTYFSSKRNFQLTIENKAMHVPLNKFISWPIHLKSLNKSFSIEEATLTINGGMPHHGHGLPTSPSIKAITADGDFIIEGLKFSMPGFWEVKVIASSKDITDSTTISFTINK